MADDELQRIKERFDEFKNQAMGRPDIDYRMELEIRAVMADHAALIAEVEELRKPCFTAMVMQEDRKLREAREAMGASAQTRNIIPAEANASIGGRP